jgi:CD20-like family.
MSGGSDNADVTDASPPSLPVTPDALVVKSPADSFSSTLKTRSSTVSGSFQDDGQSEENSFLFLGVAQMLLGVLMAVFGILAILHEASLSNIGAGLWGGAVAMAAGVVGVLAGLRNCYSVRDTSPPPTLTITSFLALCLVSLAVSNLVVVLAVIGLVRDGQRSDGRAIEDEQASIEFRHFLENIRSLCQLANKFAAKNVRSHLRYILILSPPYERMSS